MRKITAIIIHASDSDYPQHDNVETIYQWHVVERGFSDIGYHYIITKDGKVHDARPVWKVGAHCRGMNQNSIGICLTGRHKFSPAQFASLATLLTKMMAEYKLDETDIYGHYHFSNKTCPNFNVTEYKDKYL